MENKKCPHCKEEILVVAKKCKHCGEWLDVQPEHRSNNPERCTMESVESKSIACRLETSIKEYLNSPLKKSNGLLFLDQISQSVLKNHVKYYAKLMQDNEIPLLLVNNKSYWRGYGFTGLLITNRNLYCKCTEDRFISSLFPKSNVISIPLQSVKKIEIGCHDHCFGTAYIGHQLVVNKEVLGLLRMGNSVLLDDIMILQLNQIFKSIE